MAQYIAFIELERGQSGDMLGVAFPDFPGLASAGDDYASAYRNAHEALSGHADVMKKHGERIPNPRTLEQIEKEWDDFPDWKDTKYAVAYIDLLPSSETKRYTISMDAKLMARIDSRTKNRSAFLASAAERMLSDNRMKA
ncbi:MAG: type II toxin-antitoxin system HicB family antitoxin [Rickettsiales bacterium]|jgi:predicted RNase H-like HicB family nuclease|nr:type II toxin-antitoxin system HicB family antitoxin [Rickettsiales bacterium]